jgi:hypothetical protein
MSSSSYPTAFFSGSYELPEGVVPPDRLFSPVSKNPLCRRIPLTDLEIRVPLYDTERGLLHVQGHSVSIDFRSQSFPVYQI